MLDFGCLGAAFGALERRARPLAVISSCILLGACATSGAASHSALRADYARAAPARGAPERERTASVSGSVLERAAYVRAVLDNNPSVEAARQGYRAAISRVGQAGGFEDPMVDVGIAPLSIGSQAPLGYELTLSQKLPWFGKRSPEAAMASAEADAMKSDYEAVKRELALSAVMLYDQYFVQERSLEINAHHVELLRAMREGAVAQFASGRASAQDPLQAEAELAHMEHDAAVLASQRDVTVAQMNELLHRAPELPLPPPPQELPRPPPFDVRDGKRLQAEAATQRSEISAAHQRARAQQSRAERAGREGYPDVTLSTSYNSMWEMPEHRWMVGVGFNLPIQSGQRASAAEDEAMAERARFESEAERMTDAVRTQVFVALKQVQESEHVMGLLQNRLLPVARDQVDAARAGFVTSQNSFLAVIEAEKNLRGVELDYQLTQAECDRHRAELERALGRIPGLGDAEGAR